MSSLVLKCPHCEYTFESPFQSTDDIQGINTPCPKCANSFEIESNQN